MRPSPHIKESPKVKYIMDVELNRKPVYVSGRQASKHFGVTTDTLRRWHLAGLIQAIRTTTKKQGGHRRYDINSYGANQMPARHAICHPMPIEEVKRKGETQRANICYCRVSSIKQTDDLRRQVEDMQRQFPDCEIVTDVGSGLNFKRRGLLALIKRALEGGVGSIVVAHRDRLCRFGFELIEWLLEQYGVVLKVLDSTLCSSREEMCKDILSIVHVFSCRENGKRRYKTKKTVEKVEDENECAQEPETSM
jgi:putative resolvase